MDKKDSIGVCVEKDGGCDSLQRDKAVCISPGGECVLFPNIPVSLSRPLEFIFIAPGRGGGVDMPSVSSPPNPDLSY